MEEPPPPDDAPLEMGRVYLAHIEESQETGESLADVNGHVVLVPGARPGEDVQIRITKVFGRIAIGEIVRP